MRFGLLTARLRPSAAATAILTGSAHRSGTLAIAGALGVLAGCYDDGFLQGRACADDSECGSLPCVDGFCGRAPAEAGSEDDGGAMDESDDGDATSGAEGSTGDGDGTAGDGDGTTGDGDGDGTTGDGDGDGTTGDGDGDGTTGDGDGDGTTGDGDGDGTTGDGDGTTGDGDGDGSTGDGDGDGTSGDGDGTSGDGDGTSGDGDGTAGDGDGTSGDGDGTSGDGDGTAGDGDGTSGDGDGTSGDGDGDGTTGDGDGSAGDGDGDGTTTGDGDGTQTCGDCLDTACDPILVSDCLGDPDCSALVGCVDNNGFDWHFCLNSVGAMNSTIAAIQSCAYNSCDLVDGSCPNVINPNDACEACDLANQDCMGTGGCIFTQDSTCACVGLCELSDTLSTWNDCLSYCGAYGASDTLVYDTEACLRDGCGAACEVGDGACTGNAWAPNISDGCAQGTVCDLGLCRADPECDCTTRCVDAGIGTYAECTTRCDADADQEVLDFLVCAYPTCGNQPECDITPPAGACEGCLAAADCVEGCQSEPTCSCVVDCMNLAELTSGGIPPDFVACVSQCPGADTSPEVGQLYQCSASTTCNGGSCNMNGLIWERTFVGVGPNPSGVARSLDLDDQDAVYVAAQVSGANDQDLQARAYDAAGAERWDMTYDSPGTAVVDLDDARGIDVLDDGSAGVVAGVTDVTDVANLFGQRFLGGDGTMTWMPPVVTLAGGQAASGNAAAIATNGNMFFAGERTEVFADTTAITLAYSDAGGPIPGPTDFYDVNGGSGLLDRVHDLHAGGLGGQDALFAVGGGGVSASNENAFLRVLDATTLAEIDTITEDQGNADNAFTCVAKMGGLVMAGGWLTSTDRDSQIRVFDYSSWPTPATVAVSRTWGFGPGDDEITGCGFDSDGNLIVSGNGGGNAYIRKMDPFGNVIWMRQLPAGTQIHDLAVASNRDIFVAGEKPSPTSQPEGWVARFRP